MADQLTPESEKLLREFLSSIENNAHAVGFAHGVVTALTNRKFRAAQGLYAEEEVKLNNTNQPLCTKSLQ